MAVQKKRKTRAKRDTRRAHDALGTKTLAVNELGELHIRHNLAADGTYRGKQIIKPKVKKDKAEDNSDNQKS